MEMHIGQLIRKRLEEIGMKKSEFARRINKTSQNVYDIFERKSIDTALLGTISEVLDFNFFEPLSYTFSNGTHADEQLRELAAKYSSTTHVLSKLRETEHELALSQAAIMQLKKEIEYLKEINSLLRKK
ncbi:MAG: hypothetical protein RIT43_2326 [Bacteroidota bacterium]|jgi:transcriptional regulator with XRE-family HTH domain